jgi:hypothetical protein
MGASWWWKTPKYNNKVVTTTDGKFDSKLEYYRWCELLILERAKNIKDLKRQVKFVLIDKSKYGREISYIADFTYYIGDKLIVEDTKSSATITRVYTLKKRLMAERYGIIIQEIGNEKR